MEKSKAFQNPFETRGKFLDYCADLIRPILRKVFIEKEYDDKLSVDLESFGSSLLRVHGLSGVELHVCSYGNSFGLGINEATVPAHWRTRWGIAAEAGPTRAIEVTYGMWWS